MKIKYLIGVILAMAVINARAQNPITSLLTNLVANMDTGTNYLQSASTEIRIGGSYQKLEENSYQSTLGLTHWFGRFGAGGELYSDSATDVIEAAQVQGEFRLALGRNAQAVGIGGLGYDWKGERGYGVIGARLAYGLTANTSAYAGHEIHLEFRRNSDGPESFTKIGVQWEF